jgi:hypothetical protein
VSTTHTVQRWAVVHDLFISVTSPGKVSDEDWQKFMQAFRASSATKYLAGIFGGTAEVSSVQRKQAAELLRSRGIRTAVVTDDTLVRGLVTAVGWLGANVNAFAWTDTKGALKYLGVTEIAAERALTTLTALRSEVESMTD